MQPDRYRLERILALSSGLTTIGIILYLAVRNEPFADENIVVLLRIVLSVAIGGIGATIPGFLRVE